MEMQVPQVTRMVLPSGSELGIGQGEASAGPQERRARWPPAQMLCSAREIKASRLPALCRWGSGQVPHPCFRSVLEPPRKVGRCCPLAGQEEKPAHLPAGMRKGGCPGVGRGRGVLCADRSLPGLGACLCIVLPAPRSHKQPMVALPPCSPLRLESPGPAPGALNSALSYAPAQWAPFCTRWARAALSWTCDLNEGQSHPRASLALVILVAGWPQARADQGEREVPWRREQCCPLQRGPGTIRPLNRCLAEPTFLRCIVGT